MVSVLRIPEIAAMPAILNVFAEGRQSALRPVLAVSVDDGSRRKLPVGYRPK